LNLSGLLLFFYSLTVFGLPKIKYILEKSNGGRGELYMNKFFSVVHYSPTFPRYQGFYIEPNHWSLALIFMIFIVDLLNKFSIKKEKKYWFVIYLLLFSLVLTGSRSGIFSFIIFKFIYSFNSIIFKSKLYIKWINVLILILAILGLGVSLNYIFPETFGFIIQRIKSINSAGAASSNRLIIWYNYLIKYINNFSKYFFGIGNIVSIEKLNIYFYNTHNSYLDLLYFNGIIGLMLIIGFQIIIVTKLIIKYLKTKKEIYNLTFSYLIAIFLHIMLNNEYYYFILYASIFLGYSILKMKVKKIEEHIDF